MSATATARPVRSCPAWCDGEADKIIGLCMGEVHSAGDLTVSLAQAPGELAPVIEMNDDLDQELSLTLGEAEQLGTLLLGLVRLARASCSCAAVSLASQAGMNLVFGDGDVSPRCPEETLAALGPP
jgi:hypothetical protein